MRRSGMIDPELVRAIDEAARAEASVPDDEKPDYVEIGGERYWRRKPEPTWDPGKPPGTKEGYTRVLVDIAPHAQAIRLDNRLYYHGIEYEVRDDQVATFRDIMARTWDHEKATGGANSRMAGTRNLTYSMSTGTHHWSRPGPAGVSE